MPKLALEYLLFVFVACSGVLQIAAARGGFKGLLFFRRPVAGYIFGALAIVGAFWWFFTSDNRNILPTLEGFQQTGLFLSAGLMALLFTLFVSSLAKAGLLEDATEETRQAEPDQGLEVLKERTYLQAITRGFSRRRGKG